MNVLDELRSRPQWVCWRPPNKRPLRPDGAYASTTDRSTWSSYDDVMMAGAAGLRPGFVFAADDPYVGIDVDDCIDSEGILHTRARALVDTLGSYAEITPSGRGLHIIVRADLPSPKGMARQVDGMGVEIYSQGRYFTMSFRPLSTPLPIRTATTDLMRLIAQLWPQQTHRVASPSLRHNDPYRAAAFAAAETTVSEAADGGRNHALNREAYSLAGLPGVTPHEIEQTLLPAAIAAGLPEREARATIHSGITAGSAAPRSAPAPTNGGNGRATNAVPNTDGYPLTGEGDARRLLRTHGHEILYCAAIGWMYWDGRRWTPDQIGRVQHMCRMVAADWYDSIPPTKDCAAERKRAAAFSTRSGRDNALALGQTSVAVDAAKLDADPDVINVQNGILDLVTLELRPHDPRGWHTKVAGSRYDPAAKCPRWLRFLDEIFEKNRAVIQYWQRFLGYCLSGHANAQAMVIAWGSGRNGKSVLMEAARAVMGDYCRSAATTLFTEPAAAGPNEALADLAGVRLALMSETDAGVRLAEGTVKALTGGEVVRAERKYQRSFEFRPSAKFVLTTNAKPRIRGHDLGIWRRIMLLPFRWQVPADAVNPRQLEELLAEKDGILTWAAVGHQAYLERGLAPPDEVTASTDAYRADEDFIGGWISAQCRCGPGLTASSAALMRSLTDYAEEEGARAPNANALSARLTAMAGVRQIRTHGGRRAWSGIALVKDEAPTRS